jgi:hypothetical protein
MKKQNQPKGSKKPLPIRQTKVVREVVTIRKVPKMQVRSKSKKQLSRAQCYYECLTSPFSPQAMGAKVPDTYEQPTVTYHSQGSMVLGNITGLVSSGGMMFLPTACLTAIDTLAQVSGSGFSTIVTSSLAGYTSNNNWKGLNTEASLNNILGSVRVVGGGLKIKNLQPQLSATGRLFIATIPCTREVPCPNILTNLVSTNQAINRITGIPATTLASSGIMQLPGCVEVACTELVGKEIEVVFKQNSPAVMNFRSTNDTNIYGTGYYESDQPVFTSTAYTIAASGNSDVNDPSGWNAIVIWYEGLPLTVGNWFDVELILHYEGAPQLAANTSAPVPSAPFIESAKFNTGETLERILAAAARFPFARALNMLAELSFPKPGRLALQDT